MLLRIFLLILTLSVPSSPSAKPKPTPTPSPDELVCRDPFPCPPGLEGRIRFWVDVFHKWGATHRILHDNATPERVYSVIETTDPCARGRGSKTKAENDVERERKRVKELLLTIAQHLENSTPLPEGSEEERRILTLFVNPDAAAIREAAENVRCQEGNRDRFQEGLNSYAVHREMVARTLAEAKLPTDLQYLPFVESSYNPRALSRLNAAGLWQFMPKTARLFGLKVRDGLDERFDPEKATAAAARYLRMSFADLGNLAAELDPAIAGVLAEAPDAVPARISPFVVTSYNYGVAGMKQAMREEGTEYVDVLNNYSGKRFRTAVQNFYASFLAARHVAVAMTPSLPEARPLPTDSAAIPRKIFAARLADHLKIPLADLRELNPALTRSVWKGRRPIPEGYLLKLPKREKGWDEALASLWKTAPETALFAEESYRVKPGETTCGIANRKGVSCQELIAANDLDSRGMIRAGQILFIPGSAKPEKQISPVPASSPPPATTATAAEIAKAFGTGQDFSVADGTISVEPDETIGHYAEWLGLADTQSIRALNGLSRGDALLLGKSLKLPISGEEQKRSFERRRAEFHRTIEEEFHQLYEIVGTETYTVRPGENEWQISSREEVPLWLMKRFNLGLLSKPLRAGQVLVLPTIQDRVVDGTKK